MLTYRTGAAGAPSVAGSMAVHLAVETDVPELQAKLSEYYGNSMKAEPGMTAALPRRDMNPAVAEKLGIDPNKPLSAKEVANLLTGLRADGEEIAGKATHDPEKKTRIAYIDLCLSAPKSLSVALAFAPTDAERAILDRAHRDAVDATIKHIAEHIGVARKGDGGKKGWDPGHVAWVQFDHYTARPTVKIGRVENGIHATELVTLKVAGDPQRHTHVIVPNMVVTDEGRVGGLHLQQIKDRIHEWGSVYQAFLATNLRRSGIDVELDSDTTKSLNERMARLTSVPRWVCDLFSKRSKDGEDAAKAYAKANGIDWDGLSADDKAKLLKGGTKAARRSKELGRVAQTDDLADYREWKKQAAEANYQHRSVLRPGEGVEPGSVAQRLPAAYEASLPLLAHEIQNRSTFEGSLARVCAAKGLIAAGIQNPDEINAITRAYRTEGVMQQGGGRNDLHQTALRWGRLPGDRFSSFTTEMHIEHEREAIALFTEAAKDKSTDLTLAQIEAAVQRVVARNPDKKYDFTSGHGQSQRQMMDRLATSGRIAVGIGVHGAGKTTLIEPLVDAWHAAGRKTIGVTIAWRQTGGLVDAGIAKQNTFALTPFLFRAEKGRVELDSKTVVVVDEIAQVGTRQLLQLARLQKKHGFQIVAMGDQMQCQSIEAGNTIRLLEKVLGKEQIPEILTTVRQFKERDQETSLMFRKGDADMALRRKDEDGQLRIVAGGYQQAINATVDLWQERVAQKPDDPRYTIGISVPTNHDVRAIGAEIRSRRRKAGEVGPDRVVIKAASDQVGDRYDLPVAVGDRLRLFKRVNNGNRGVFGDNGTVVEVVGIKPKKGLELRNPRGTVAFIPWDKFRKKEGAPIMLTYGDALTIDSRQGDTVFEHITAMPSGSQAVNGFKAYTTESRHRVQSWIVTSQGEEMQEIISRRPLGDQRNNETDTAKIREAIIDNMARNLSRHTEKMLATDFLEQANNVRLGAIRSMQAAWFHQETQPRQKPIKQHMAAKRAEAEVAKVSKAVTEQLSELAGAMEATKTSKAVEQKPAGQQKPAAPKAQKKMSDIDVMMAFKDAAISMGLKIDGMPIMDGKKHYVPLLDGKRGKKQGGYKAYLDGRPAGTITNYKTGEVLPWKADVSLLKLSTPEEQERMRRESLTAKERRAAELREKEERTSAEAIRLWKDAKPALPTHPYLVAKQVKPHNLREGQVGQVTDIGGKSINVAGRLLVPMRDTDGKLWNLQMIDRKGRKVFLSGRKRGLFTTVGKPAPGQPVIIGEGYATGATLYETTSLCSVVAFDSGNIPRVAEAIREKDPGQKFIYGADNDHHLPRKNPPEKNVGIEKAERAAAVTGGPVVAPDFPPESKGTDWNDYAVKHGREATRKAFADKLAAHGMSLPDQAAQEAVQTQKPQAGGEITQAHRDAARAEIRPRKRSYVPPDARLQAKPQHKPGARPR